MSRFAAGGESRGHVPPRVDPDAGPVIVPRAPGNRSLSSVTPPPVQVEVRVRVSPDSTAARPVCRCLRCGMFFRPGYDGNATGHESPQGWCESESEDGLWYPTLEVQR